MTAPTMPDTEEATYQAIEVRAEVESLESLQAKRRELIPRFAQLAAQFRGGQNASVETKRKAHRSLVMQEIADSIRQEWAKSNTAGKEYKEPSESMLERMARASDRHIKYCDTLEAEYVEYVMLESEIEAIKERIRNRETCLNVYNAELRLAR